MLTLLLFHSVGWLHWPGRRVSGCLASGWVVRAPNSPKKIEHGSINWFALNHWLVTRPSTVWAGYTGIYSAKCTVSAEHLVGLIGPLMVVTKLSNPEPPRWRNKIVQICDVQLHYTLCWNFECGYLNFESNLRN